MHSASGYRPIRIGVNTPSPVISFIRDPVEWTLQDVRAMLRLPLPELGITPACNFAIAQVLLAHIAGVATVFFDATAEPRDRFVQMLEKFYPWDAESHHVYNQVDRMSGPRILYDVIRNPFAHSLGLDTKMVGGPRVSKRVVRRGRSLQVGVGRIVATNGGAGLSEGFLQELDAPQRPSWLPPTITRDGDGISLSVEALYWGTRAMMENLTMDAAALAHAAQFLRETA